MTLFANYIEIRPLENMVLYRYVIEVDPKAAGKKLVQIVRLVLESDFLTEYRPDIVSDFGSTLVSRTRLPLPEGETTLNIPYRAEGEDVPPTERAVTYRVCI